LPWSTDPGSASITVPAPLAITRSRAGAEAPVSPSLSVATARTS
jgi:hypothetical protein